MMPTRGTVKTVLINGVGGPCPFCRGDFQAGFDQDDVPIVTHNLPPCEKFAALEIDAYVAAVRCAIDAQDQN